MIKPKAMVNNYDSVFQPPRENGYSSIVKICQLCTVYDKPLRSSVSTRLYLKIDA